MRSIPVVSLAVAAALAAACAPSPPAQLEANKALVRRFNDASMAADSGALVTILTEDFTRHSSATPDLEVTSRDAFIAFQRAVAASTPDQRVTFHEMVAEGDLVAVRATYAGTQTGPMGDLPATGNAFESPFLALFRIEEGRIAELWIEWDNVYMLTQLGLFPPPAPGN